MRRRILLVGLSILFSFCTIVGVNSKEKKVEETPSSALQRYYSALKTGDANAAIELTAKFKELPAGWIKEITDDLLAAAKEGDLSMKLVSGSSKMLDECAVIIFEDGDKKRRPDYDPAFLIKQDGKWKVLPDLTNWEDYKPALTKPQIAQFKKLADWFDKESARLYDLHESEKKEPTEPREEPKKPKTRSE